MILDKKTDKLTHTLKKSLEILMQSVLTDDKSKIHEDPDFHTCLMIFNSLKNCSPEEKTEKAIKILSVIY